MDEALPSRWDPGTIHVLAWATVADEYWKSVDTRAVVLKQFDGPTNNGGHRWFLALLTGNCKDSTWTWGHKWCHFTQFPGDPPFQPTSAQQFGFEFYSDRPTDEQVVAFLGEAGWDRDVDLGIKEYMLSNAEKVKTTRTLLAGGVNAVVWRRVFGRDVPPCLFPELRKGNAGE
jgi:hypothetical protein